MSKILNDLNQLNEVRRPSGKVVIDDSHEEAGKGRSFKEHKGVYLLSFLVVVLIGLSALSMSVSMKTFTQLEHSWADSTAILQTLNKQGKDIARLQSLIEETTAQSTAEMGALTNQVNTLSAVVKGRDREYEDVVLSYNKFQSSVNESIEELKTADRLMLKKYIFLNDKIKEVQATKTFKLDSF